MVSKQTISDYRLDAMEKNYIEIKNEIKSVGNKIDGLRDEFVSKSEHKDDHGELKKRTERIEYAIIFLLVGLSIYLVTMAGSKIFH